MRCYEVVLVWGGLLLAAFLPSVAIAQAVDDCFECQLTELNGMVIAGWCEEVEPDTYPWAMTECDDQGGEGTAYCNLSGEGCGPPEFVGAGDASPTGTLNPRRSRGVPSLPATYAVSYGEGSLQWLTCAGLIAARRYSAELARDLRERSKVLML